jgi:hypothetical protein
MLIFLLKNNASFRTAELVLALKGDTIRIPSLALNRWRGLFFCTAALASCAKSIPFFVA